MLCLFLSQRSFIDLSVRRVHSGRIQETELCHKLNFYLSRRERQRRGLDVLSGGLFSQIQKVPALIYFCRFRLSAEASCYLWTLSNRRPLPTQTTARRVQRNKLLAQTGSVQFWSDFVGRDSFHRCCWFIRQHSGIRFGLSSACREDCVTYWSLCRSCRFYLSQ